MKNRESGFTLIELMLVLVMAGVLLTLAVPSFRTMMLKRSTQSSVEALVNDLRFARSEAIKRTNRVSICSSVNGATCAAASWMSGWIVFLDVDGDGAVDAADQILRVQDGLPSLTSLTANGLADYIVYQPTGWARAAARTYTFTPVDGPVRVVCVSNTGRASSRKEGTTTCS